MGPNKNTKELIAGIYDRAAGHYAQHQDMIIWGKRLVEIAALESSMQLLDAACGTGSILLYAAERYQTTGSIVGVDISPGMLSIAISEIDRRLLPNASVSLMDLEMLGFNDAVFDGVFCGFSLFFLPDLQKGLAELQRVLKRGETLAVSTFGRDDPNFAWFGQLVGSYHLSRPELVTTPLSTPDALEEELTEAGFQDVEVTFETTDVIFADENAWWNMLWAHTVRTLLEQMDELSLARFKQEIFQNLAQHKRSDGIHQEQEVIYATART